MELSGDQKRLLAFAHAHGDRFTSRDYQKLTGLDIYGASNSIKDLVRKGVVRSAKKGSRIYEIAVPVKARPEMPNELVQLLPIFRKKREITNSDIRKVLKVSRPTASRVTKDLCDKGRLKRSGERRWTRYELVQDRMNQPRHASGDSGADA